MHLTIKSPTPSETPFWIAVDEEPNEWSWQAGQADEKVKFLLLTNGTVLDKEDQDDDDGDAEHERGRLKQWSPIARLGGLLVLLLTQLALTDSLPASSWLIRFICFVALLY